jgi:hypothetical protein
MSGRRRRRRRRRRESSAALDACSSADMTAARPREGTA